MGFSRRHEGVCLLALILAAWATQAGAQPKPTLEILGGNTAQGVKRLQAESRLELKLRIQSVTDAPVDSLKVVVSPLQDATGQLTAVQWEVADKNQDTPVSVAALGSVTLTVKAQLPAVGTYTGDIFLIYGGALTRVPLSVTLVAQPAPVVVKKLLPVLATADAMGSSEATVTLTLEPTSSQELTLKPLVFGMSRVTRGNQTVPAPVTLKNPQDITLKEGAPSEVQLQLTGLDGAGEYKGTLHLKSKDQPAVEQEIQLFLKEHWAIALLYIFSGIGLSMLLRWVSQIVQPRLELQQGVLVLREELEQEGRASEPLDALERRMLTTVLSEADRLNARIATGSLKTVEATTSQAVLEGKRDLFPVWLAIRRQVREIRPFKLQEAYANRLLQAENRLLDAKAKADELVQSHNELTKTPEDIADAVRKELKAAVEKLQIEVKSHENSPLGPRLDAEVSPHLTAALRHIAANENAQAFAVYEQARGAYLQLLVQQLSAQLPKEPLPLGFTQATWDALRERVLAELGTARAPGADLDIAFEAYTRAHQLFLAESAAALLEELPHLEKKVEEDTEIDDAVKAQRKAWLEALKPRLQGVLQTLQDGKFTDAATAFEQIRRELQKEFSPEAVRGVTEQLQAIGKSLSALAPKVSEGARGVLRGLSTGPLNLRSVSRVRWVANLVVTLFVAVIASLLGVNTLWNNDPVWGGWTAHATAFLWGLGLHQATFSTLATLMEGIVGKKKESA